MDMLEGETQVRDYGLERLIMLSDGVFAIALTLLAIELKPPPDWDGTVAGLLQGSLLGLIAFATSFGLIGMYWAYHRLTFRYYGRADPMVSLLNFVVLAFVVLIPFASRLLAERGPQSEALYVYIGVVAALGAALAAQWTWGAFLGGLTRGLALGYRIFLLCNLLFVMTAMCALAVIGARPGLWWTYLVMAAIFMALLVLRRRFVREAPA